MCSKLYYGKKILKNDLQSQAGVKSSEGMKNLSA